MLTEENKKELHNMRHFPSVSAEDRVVLVGSIEREIESLLSMETLTNSGLCRELTRLLHKYLDNPSDEEKTFFLRLDRLRLRKITISDEIEILEQDYLSSEILPRILKLGSIFFLSQMYLLYSYALSNTETPYLITIKAFLKLFTLLIGTTSIIASLILVDSRNPFNPQKREEISTKKMVLNEIMQRIEIEAKKGNISEFLPVTENALKWGHFNASDHTPQPDAKKLARKISELILTNLTETRTLKKQNRANNFFKHTNSPPPSNPENDMTIRHRPNHR